MPIWRPRDTWLVAIWGVGFGRFGAFAGQMGVIYRFCLTFMCAFFSFVKFGIEKGDLSFDNGNCNLAQFDRF